MSSKFNRKFKKYIPVFTLVIFLYFSIVSLAAVFYSENPQLVFTDQRYENQMMKIGDLVDPFPDGKNESELEEESKLFDAQVVVMSNIERHTEYKLHLFALPGQISQVYRDFSIYIFTNQETDYIVKLDNQTLKTGKMFWMERIDTRSEYDKVTLEIILANQSGVERVFNFKKLELIDSPWQTKDEGDDDKDKDVPDVVKPYLQMTQGDFNLFIAKRVFADIVSVICGIILGIYFAAIKADLRGIGRIL